MSQDTYIGAPDPLPRAPAIAGDVTWSISVCKTPPLYNFQPTSDHELTEASQKYFRVQRQLI